MSRACFRVVLAVAIAVFALAATAGDAVAAAPWWHVDTLSSPATQAGKDSLVTLEVSNLGDAAVDGAVSPVTIVDQLPSGVVPRIVEGAGGGSYPVGVNGVETLIHCGISEQTVTCAYAGPLLAYERFIVSISVEVEPGAGGGVSKVAVTGGGASSLTVQDPIELGEGVPGYGLQHYEVTPEEEGGGVSTQAGAHPFQLTTTLAVNTKAVTVAEPDGVHQEVQPVALTKDLRFNLPPGLVGNPTPIPKCKLSVFLAPSNTTRCPSESVVGVATSIIDQQNGKPANAPWAEAVALYNIEPSVGEPARFGFDTQVGPIVLDTSVRTGGNYGVVVTVPNILDSIAVIGSQVTFWGVPGDARHDTSRGTCLDQFEGSFQALTKFEFSCPLDEEPKPFLIMPTSCEAPLATSVEADPWSAPGAYAAPRSYTFSNAAGEPFAEDGCNHLTFEPSISLTPDGTQAATPTGLSADVHVDQQASLNPNGDAESAVKDTTVTLPPGVVLDPSGADGLQACPLLTGVSAAQEELEEKDLVSGINLDTPQPADCPEASKVGTLEIRTPLLPNPLVGAAYLATQQANPFGSLIALYLVARDPVSGVLIKIAGKVSACERTGETLEGVVCQAPGQLISTFNDTPELPFEDLTLHFFGGSRAPLATPHACGSYTTTAAIAPWSGEPAAELVSSPFEIASGPTGGACLPTPAPFTPSLTGGSTNVQAGALTSFATTMSREDGQQTLQAITLHMPAGLSGELPGVELCPEPRADEGLCGPNSLIGETTVSVGVGGTPFTVKGGKVYLTGPYKGAPFGLSIVDPAKAGPFDLEDTPANHPACDCLVVRAKVEVDPHTAALTVTSDNEGPYKIPTIIEGIPLQIKHVYVTIDRPGFTFNPTNCEPLSITGTLDSTEGASSQVSVPFQATNCAALGFAPKFAVSTAGKASRLDGTSLDVKLTYPQAAFGSQANIKQVKVELPKQLPSRLPTLQKACTAAQFDSNPAGCPSASIVGHAKAISPLVPVPLEGPAYFVSNGGEAFPNLIVVLQGYSVTIDLVGDTFISKAGVTSSTFKTVPDAPVGSFELDLPAGRYSALTALGNPCKNKLTMPTEFIAQNGAEIKQNTKISVTGCPKAKKATHKKKRKAKGRKAAAKHRRRKG